VVEIELLNLLPSSTFFRSGRFADGPYHGREAQYGHHGVLPAYLHEEAERDSEKKGSQSGQHSFFRAGQSAERSETPAHQHTEFGNKKWWHGKFVVKTDE